MKRLLTLLGLLFPGSVRAVSITSYSWKCDGFLYCGSGQNAVGLITTKVIGTVSFFITPLAVVVFIYGAIRMIASQGDEGKEAGKKALIWASVGLAAALLTGAILRYLCDYLYVIGGAASGGANCSASWL